VCTDNRQSPNQIYNSIQLNSIQFNAEIPEREAKTRALRTGDDLA
jgi:hypothetical protein